MRNKTLLTISVLAASVASLLVAGCASNQSTHNHGAHSSNSPITKSSTFKLRATSGLKVDRFR